MLASCPSSFQFERGFRTPLERGILGPMPNFGIGTPFGMTVGDALKTPILFLVMDGCHLYTKKTSKQRMARKM